MPTKVTIECNACLAYDVHRTPGAVEVSQGALVALARGKAHQIRAACPLQQCSLQATTTDRLETHNTVVAL